VPSNPASSGIRSLFRTNHRYLLDKIVSRLFSEARGEILIIGAGHNRLVDMMPGSANLTTIDIDQDLPAISAVADCEKLPFSSGSFDWIIGIEVLEHVSDLDAAMTEIQRCLSDEGKFLLSMPFMYHIHGDPADYRRLTPSGIIASLPATLHVETLISFGTALNIIFDTISSSSTIGKLMRPVFLIVLIIEQYLVGRPSQKFVSGVVAVASKSR
jgi:SAM-dependent methyltransferase